MDSDLRVAANAVVVDSDGQGNLLWGEWRAIVSTSLLGSSGGNSFEGDVTFNNNVIIDSDLTVNGDFIFDDKRFNDTSMFTVKNVTGNIIIAGHLFQVDSDLPEPGLPAS